MCGLAPLAQGEGGVHCFLRVVLTLQGRPRLATGWPSQEGQGGNPSGGLPSVLAG